MIAGPTASGKSGLALRLARALREQRRNAEIVCADSVTVYRGMEIGAAKPSLAEQTEFRHHLLNVADIHDSFTAGDFVRLALPAIADIHARGAAALIVGGTGFYLRALLRGMASNEAEDLVAAAAIRLSLEARASVEGWSALHAEVLLLDPASAGTVHPNDHYRILRALQAMALYEKPWSELNRTARASPFRFPGTRFFCLDFPKIELKERIAERSRAMLAAGLLEEVKALIAAGVPPEAKPLQSVGYRECVETLQGKEQESTLAERISLSTARLAKQQRTWFRGETGVEWLTPDFWENLQLALSLDH